MLITCVSQSIKRQQKIVMKRKNHEKDYYIYHTMWITFI